MFKTRLAFEQLIDEVFGNCWGRGESVSPSTGGDEDAADSGAAQKRHPIGRNRPVTKDGLDGGAQQLSSQAVGDICEGER